MAGSKPSRGAGGIVLAFTCLAAAWAGLDSVGWAEAQSWVMRSGKMTEEWLDFRTRCP
jgi:hypothetical protein